MSSWQGFVDAEPAFAQQVRTVLDAHEVKVLASLRADGAPRVSGIEVAFDGQEDGQEMVLGSMPGARKGADLRRDPRFALHSVPPIPVGTAGALGDVKITGRVVPDGPLTGEHPGDRFVVDVLEVAWVGLNDAGDRLVVQWWTPEDGVRRVERD